MSAAALLLGLGLLALALVHVDPGSIERLARQMGVALPLVLLPSAAWHLLRTAAWQRCFPAGEPVSFGRAVRVRLAAEALSFVTIRGVAGEPLKVLLLAPQVPATVSAAAVALERAAYLLVTAVIIVFGALVAAATLNLSSLWIRVFAITAAVCLVLIVALLRVAVRVERKPSMSGNAEGRRSALRRFANEFAAQLRDLLRVNRRRLAVLILLESAAFAMMALEVWGVLWAAGAPVTAVAALATETFTRVASFLSAFIPANLGALEASSVAAASAVGAGGGAAALALVRRLRGLLWCVVGFVIYPRQDRMPAERRPQASEGLQAEPLMVVQEADSDVSILDRVGGLPIGERLARAAARAGYQRLLVSAPRQQREWRQLALRRPGGICITVIDDRVNGHQALDATPSESRHVVMSDFVPFKVDETGMLQGVRVRSRQDLPGVEGELRRSVFKSTDGYLARFNRRLSIPLSLALIRWTRMSPHVMSVFIIGLGFYAGWLFGDGGYLVGVLAAVVSLAASILDGCDGELARFQYKDSAFGCWLDTFGDYTYYLAIFAGLAVGTMRRSAWPGFWWIGVAAGVGTLLTFALLILLRRRITNGRPEDFRTIAKSHYYGTRKRWTFVVAKLSNVATRATMPYGILALALVNALPVVLILAALGSQIYWISLAVQLRKMLRVGHAIEAVV